MAVWRDMKAQRQQEGLWIGPHHPCKLQIRGRHMWLKTNIKIDMSCKFKQEDTAEPHRRRVRQTPHRAHLGDSSCSGQEQMLGISQFPHQPSPEHLWGCGLLRGWPLFYTWTTLTGVVWSFCQLPEPKKGHKMESRSTRSVRPLPLVSRSNWF